MKILGIIFIAACVFALGIAAVKFGWFDAAINWLSSFVK